MSIKEFKQNKLSLKEIGHFYGGLSGKSGKDFGIGDAKFITFLNVINNVVANSELTGYVDVKKGEQQNKVLPGDLLFNGSSETPEEVAFPSLVPEALKGSYLNSFCFGFRFEKFDRVDPLFFAYYLRSKHGRQYISQLAQGSTRYNISKTALLKVEWALPEIEEQKAIAKALSDIDELISTIRNEIQKKESLKKSLLQKLIPGNFLTEKLSNGWQLKSLREIGEISGAGVDKVIRVEDIEISLLNYMDVYRNAYIDQRIKFTSMTATKLQLKNCNLQKGDVLFTPTSETPGDIANSSVVTQDLPNTCYSYHLVRFRPFQEISLSYLAYVFDVEDFRNQALRAAEGSGTRYVITLPRFRNMVIPMPPLKVQEEIGRALESISGIIKNDRIQLAKYECIKQGMMNDLLTGKVRLA